MAAAFSRHLGGERVQVFSGGSEPAAAVNSAAVAAMAEVDIDIGGIDPIPWTEQIIADADVVVTMGCGDECPIFAGVRYEDWSLADPAGRPIAEVRAIRDEIKSRVVTLLGSLEIPIKIEHYDP